MALSGERRPFSFGRSNLGETMGTQEPPPARGFIDLGEDLTRYRIELWLAGLSRKTWVYLQRLATAALTTDDDNAWLDHEIDQARCRLKTLEWLRTVNIQTKGE